MPQLMELLRKARLCAQGRHLCAITRSLWMSMSHCFIARSRGIFLQGLLNGARHRDTVLNQIQAIEVIPWSRMNLKVVARLWSYLSGAIQMNVSLVSQAEQLIFIARSIKSSIGDVEMGVFSVEI